MSWSSSSLSEDDDDDDAPSESLEESYKARFVNNPSKNAQINGWQELLLLFSD